MPTPSFPLLPSPTPLQLDLSAVPRGIDHHHCDVRISPAFCQAVEAALENLLDRLLSPDTPFDEGLQTTLTARYQDMMAVFQQRQRSEFTAEEGLLLMMALLRYLLISSRDCLDTRLVRANKDDLEERLSGDYDRLLYLLNKGLFDVLLPPTGETTPGKKGSPAPAAVWPLLQANPLLLARTPFLPALLEAEYPALPPLDTERFMRLNAALESLHDTLPVGNHAPSLQQALADDSPLPDTSEDALIQALEADVLSSEPPSSDDSLRLHSDWLDLEDNLRLLFDETALSQQRQALRQRQGWQAWWQARHQLQHSRDARHQLAQALQAAGIAPGAEAEAAAQLSRLRYHLKLRHFSAQVFRHIRLLNDRRDVELSRHFGTLYHLPLAAEIEKEQHTVVHHSILKVNLRGTTALYQALVAAGKDAGAFFTTHLYQRVTALCESLGGLSLQSLGNSLTLGFHEYEHSPHLWHSVSLACLSAQGLLDLLEALNQQAGKLGLPGLESGLGISFHDAPPCFLQDGSRPVLLSPALDQADDLTSCQWMLRRTIDPAPFRVDVLCLGTGKDQQGQDLPLLRYNVNGILLDNSAFIKLQSELKLSRHTVSLEEGKATFYFGLHADHGGQGQPLLIREGEVREWRSGTIIERTGATQHFYEVVTDKALLQQLQQLQGADKA